MNSLKKTDIYEGPGLRGNLRYWTLAGARATSFFGNGFGRVALAIGILRLPGMTAGTLSLIIACQILPQIPVLLLGGTLADRVSRSTVMVIADLMAGMAWAGLAVCLVTQTSNLFILCILVLLAGSGSALFAPANSGALPQIVAKSQLQQANGYLRATQNVALLLGLGLGGVITSLAGPAFSLAIDAVTFFASAALISTLRLGRLPILTETFLTSVSTGVSYFFSQRWIWAITLQSALVVLTLSAFDAVLGPLFFYRNPHGANSWSWLLAGQAVGMIAGATLTSRLKVSRPLLVALSSLPLLTLPMFLLFWQVPILYLILSMGLAGIAIDVFNVLWSTTLQRRVPQDLLSRVFSIDLLGQLALAPIGVVVAGHLAAEFGPKVTLAGFGGLVILGCMAVLLIAPEVVRMKANDDDEGEES